MEGFTAQTGPQRWLIGLAGREGGRKGLASDRQSFYALQLADGASTTHCYYSTYTSSGKYQ